MLKQTGSDHKRLRILIASAEAEPWSKTGGLGDVTTALSKSLSYLGHEVALIVPYYRQTEFARNHTDQILDTEVSFEVPVGERRIVGQVYRAGVSGTQVKVWLVNQQDYFDRPDLYGDSEGDYRDNCERFVFFSRAVLEVARHFSIKPDLIHVNDWQTGLIPALLQTEYRGTPGFENTASVFTIHNLAFQGRFTRSDMDLTGLDWKYFNWRQMESDGQLNLLKTGISFCNQITTVSPTYAKEIQTEETGCGLHALLHHRSDELTGILNGIDGDQWNPSSDKFIPENYGTQDFSTQKLLCKSELQKKMGLSRKPQVPLFGMVSRLTDQKGCDLIVAQAQQFLQRDLQLVFLGAGEERYEQALRDLARHHPGKVATCIGFDERLAHEIEAGSDFYLMPSQYEPCGLNQMYSLAYGTIPLVRATGGLADSVVDTSPETLKNGTATGIVFTDYDSNQFLTAVDRCLKLYQATESCQQVIKTGMKQDFSWEKSAAKYLSVYRKAIECPLPKPS